MPSCFVSEKRTREVVRSNLSRVEAKKDDGRPATERMLLGREAGLSGKSGHTARWDRVSEKRLDSNRLGNNVTYNVLHFLENPIRVLIRFPHLRDAMLVVPESPSNKERNLANKAASAVCPLILLRKVLQARRRMILRAASFGAVES